MDDRSQARPYGDEPPMWRTPLIVVVVILAAVALALGLAVVLGDDDGTSDASPSAIPSDAVSVPPSPVQSAAASAGSSSAPSAAASSQPSEAAGPEPVVPPPDDVLPPGSVAQVTVDGLRVREGPTTGSELITTLASGNLVAIGWSYVSPNLGPVQADGFIWYPIGVLDDLPPVPHEPFENPDVIGWVAGADANASFVELVPARCTGAEPTLEVLQSLLPWEQLSCYGSRSLTVEGILGCGGCGGFIPGTFEPAWLAYPESLDLLSVEPQDRLGPFQLWFPPDVQRPEVASILRVTGHFDDAAASECAIAFGEPDPQPIDETTALYSCRAKFVVESFEVLGIDEDFPFG